MSCSCLGGAGKKDIIVNPVIFGTKNAHWNTWPRPIDSTIAVIRLPFAISTSAGPTAIVNKLAARSLKGKVLDFAQPMVWHSIGIGSLIPSTESPIPVSMYEMLQSAHPVVEAPSAGTPHQRLPINSNADRRNHDW